MKRTIKYNAASLLLLAAVLMFTACEEQEEMMFDSSLTGIYYTADSVVYSFGVTSLEVTSRTLQIPVKIMGAPAAERRSFKVEVIKEQTTAVAGTHYTIPTELFIEADSVNGSIPLEIFREALGDEQTWKAAFRLVENTHFSPVSTGKVEISTSFNNIISPPNWISYDWWTGQYKTYWPTQLGEWDPLKYLLFIQYFNEMETKAYSTYKNLLALYGENLENLDGWPYDYDFSIKKYILTPIYDYFASHPELGLSIPKPY